jgi:uncharacterized membrane protein
MERPATSLHAERRSALIRYAVTYFVTLAVFLGLDAIWLSQFAGPLYRHTLTVVMLEQYRPAPAFVLCLLYVTGMMVFVIPREEGWQTFGQTFVFGALFGLFTYGTYTLTCYTIISAWSPLLAMTDVAWGVALTAVAGIAGHWIGEQIYHRVFHL